MPSTRASGRRRSGTRGSSGEPFPGGAIPDDPLEPRRRGRRRRRAGAREALAELCAGYWFPLYAFIRRKGNDPERALDLTQGYFARLLERRPMAAADPARGRFRSFLMADCGHFLAHERERDQAVKRGGLRALLSIDARDAEGRYSLEPAHEETPERLFERDWALALLEGVLGGLRAEYERTGAGPSLKR